MECFPKSSLTTCYFGRDNVSNNKANIYKILAMFKALYMLPY